MANLVLSLALLLIFVALINVEGRILKLGSSDNELVSDGVDEDEAKPFRFNGVLSSSSSSSSCEHYYSFLPCAENIGGYMFQIVVYMYLLATGEKLLAKGSKRLFNVLGTGWFGDVFELLMVLPEIMVVLISGIAEEKEEAQSRVAVAVGMYAGSTVFCLTLQWGMCVIFGMKGFISGGSSEPTASNSVRDKLSLLTNSGIETDKRTSYSAGIMLLSLIPFGIVQLSGVVNAKSRIVILIALVVSVASLLAYFMYQIFDPWIQERSLEYTKYENLLAGFLQHVQRHAKGKLVADDGTPNVPAIKSLFTHVDMDGSKSVSASELEALVAEMKSAEGQVDKDYAMGQVLVAFDGDKDGSITEEEFIEGTKKWIQEAKQLADKEGSSHSRESLHQIVKPWIEKGRKRRAKTEQVMSRFLKHVHGQDDESEAILTADGRLNIYRIRRLFEEFDTDGNKSISQSELKKVIQSLQFGNVERDHDAAVEQIMKEFDEDGDEMITEQEFINGLEKWVEKAAAIAKTKDHKKLIEEFDKVAWNEVDTLMYEMEENRSTASELLSWDSIKSLLQIILGVLIVSFLVEPLIYSIVDVSESLGLPTFYISFIVIPLALRLKLAVSAIFPASQKSLKTASLTFSEIYGGVFMNNITGLTTLLAIVYIKGLTWDYSGEVLVVLVVCAVIGLVAYFRSTYPLWTCMLAFLLYPFSLLLVFLLHDVFGWD